MTFAIEKDVPLPPYRAPKSIYPFMSMEIGDSFFVPGGANSLRAVASTTGRRLGKKFRVKTMDGGLRVWRTE